MFKQSITYTDFNGMERKEDFYFHLSSPEVIRLEAELGTSLEDYTKKLAGAGEVKPLLDFVEKIVLNSYGKKTSDGKSFHKSDEIRKEFEYSQAYAEMFEKMLTDPDLARRFGEGVADNGKARKNTIAPTIVKE